VYGSADAAILAHETPLTTAIRRAVCQEVGHMQHLFSRNYLPTLAQYDPRLKYFEAQDQAFVFSTRAGIPLLRYDIGDTGGIYPFHTLEQRLADCQIDMQDLLARHGLQRYCWKLPFVYLFGRADLTISFYGLLIYPEHIRFGLETPALQGTLTGKFVMAVDFDARQNPFFRLTVELAPGKEQGPDLQEQVQRAVVAGLRTINSEYHELEGMIGARALPHIEIAGYNSSPHFQGGNKQRWVTPPAQHARHVSSGRQGKADDEHIP
jgi:phenylacetate-CoA ligase